MASVASRTRRLARLELVHDLARLRREWTELAEASGNLFATWEWNSIWWRHFGRGRRLLVAALEDGRGEIDVIVPLYVWAERPWRIVRLLGHGHGDLLGPIAAGENRGDTVEALRLALAAEPVDLFVGDWVPAADDWSSLGAAVLRRTGYPILRFDGTWDDFLASRSSSFRREVRHDLRKLEQGHETRLRTCGEPSGLERDLDVVFALHRARFQRHHDLFCGTSEIFQREFAACALERGWLRLWILEIDGEPAAAWYGFRFGDAYFAYQSGWDPAWSHASVGFLLEAHTARMALEEGAREYRFLEGEEPYKYRFATEDPGLETIAVARTSAGRFALAAARALRRLPAPVRRRIVR